MTPEPTSEPTSEPTRTSVTTTDGLTLAVWERGDRSRETVVAVHGYPDDHTVWDPVAELLAERFHVVAYDVRGAGASEAPDTRSGYRIPQLAADLGSVLDAVVPGKRVHLLAHDWGSIQSWGAVTDPAFHDRLATFTSISGPDLDMAAVWLRDIAKGPGDRLKQLAASYYILAFHLPVLPERMIGAGLLDRLVTMSKRRGLDPATPVAGAHQRDAVNGLELYRANFLSRVVSSRPAGTDVPVQVLAPEDDPHVTPALAVEAPVPFCTELTAAEIPGNHWVVSTDPELIADRVRSFAAAHPA